MQMGSQFATQVFQVKKKNKLIQSFQYIVKMISKKYILQLSICTNIQTPVPINENNMVKNRCGCIVHVLKRKHEFLLENSFLISIIYTKKWSRCKRGKIKSFYLITLYPVDKQESKVSNFYSFLCDFKLNGVWEIERGINFCVQ